MIKRKKRSPIWKISKEEFQDLCDKSDSISSVLSFFGLLNRGSNYKTIQYRIKEENISLEKLNINFSNNRSKNGRIFNSAIPLKDVLVENSTYPNNHLKRRLLKEGLLQNKCSGYDKDGKPCPITTEWLGKPLKLTLEHKNGNPSDNRIENLCLLCPNCHSQTDTFAGKNRKLMVGVL